MTDLAASHPLHAQPPTQQAAPDHLPSEEEETILRRERTSPAEQHSQLSFGNWSDGIRGQKCKKCCWVQSSLVRPNLFRGVTIKLLLTTDRSDNVCIVCTRRWPLTLAVQFLLNAPEIFSHFLSKSAALFLEVLWLQR